jgi:hypothetical protein
MTFGKWIHLTIKFYSNVLYLFIYTHLMMISRPKHIV